MFVDDPVICSESAEQVEETLESWRSALETRGMKVSGTKTEYVCGNETEDSGMQGVGRKWIFWKFKLSGSAVQSNGECGGGVKKSVQAGWSGWGRVTGSLFGTDGSKQERKDQLPDTVALTKRLEETGDPLW